MTTLALATRSPLRCGSGLVGRSEWPRTVASASGRRLRSSAAKVPPAEAAWLPLVLDLCAAGLLAGQPLDVALAAAAPVQLPWLGDRLRQVAAMLRLGADPTQAWQPLAGEPRLRPVAVTAIRSAASGIRLAPSLADLASELRAAARAAASPAPSARASG